MAMAIRCNAYFQFSKKQPNAVAVSCIDSSWQDLCPKCMDALNVWMKDALKEVQFVES